MNELAITIKAGALLTAALLTAALASACQKAPPPIIERDPVVVDAPAMTVEIDEVNPTWTPGTIPGGDNETLGVEPAEAEANIAP